MKPIVVLGAGSWGTALSLHLARNGNDVLLWTFDKAIFDQIKSKQENQTYMPGITLPKNITPFLDLDSLFSETYQDILIAVPSFAFLSTLEKMANFVKPSTRLLWATKGLSEEGHLLHTLVEAKGYKSYGLISGPSFAKEVARGLPTAVSLASNDDTFSKDMQARFHSPEFRVYTSNDIIGLELGGTIKNVLAIAVALAEGIGFGMNAKAALMTRGLAELRRLALAMGAHEETVMGLSGMGDIVLTCNDNQSRNRRFGLYLAEGLSVEAAEKKVAQVVEGKKNSKQVIELFKQFQLEAPICEMVYQIIYEGLDPKDAVHNLLTRPPRDEF